MLSFLRGKRKSAAYPDGSVEGILLSVYRKLNADAFWGQFPDPVIIMQDLPGCRAMIEYYPDPNRPGKIVTEGVSDPITLYAGLDILDSGVDSLFITLTHELCHPLCPGKDHGPDFVDACYARGMSTKEVPGVNAVVTQHHEIIPGRVLERLRDEWLAENAGGLSNSVSRQKAPGLPAHIPSVAAQRGRAPASAPSVYVPPPGAIHAAPSHAPRIGPDNLPSLGNVFIYADCSASMYGHGENSLKNALSKIWPIKGARLFLFNDGAENIREASSPFAIKSGDEGTSFGPILEHASTHKPDHILIFSDGSSADIDETWRVWKSTGFPISTHYCLSTAHLQGGHGRDADIKFMHDLCRGGGRATAGDDPDAIATGVISAMSGGKSVIPAQHKLPDVSGQLKNHAAAAAGAATMAGRVVQLGDRVAAQEAATAENAMRIDAALAAEQVIAGIYAQAGQVFAGQDARDAADAQNRANHAAQVTAGLQQFGQKVLTQTKAGFEGIVSRNNEAIDRGTLPVLTQITAVPMGDMRQGPAAIENKAAAILSGVPLPAGGFLPPPQRSGEAPGQYSPAFPAQTRSAPRAALPAPSEAPMPFSATTAPRSGKTIVRRKR